MHKEYDLLEIQHEGEWYVSVDNFHAVARLVSSGLAEITDAPSHDNGVMYLATEEGRIAAAEYAERERNTNEGC